MRLTVRPLTLEQANAYIAKHHRHHQPVVGHRFSIGAYDDTRCVGIAVVGRAVARMIDQNNVAEVTRLATDGTRNACSLLYAAAARACDAMGYHRIQTYTLLSEPGTSLIAAGWANDGECGGGDWNRPNLVNRGVNRTDQPMGRKQRWSRALTNERNGSPLVVEYIVRVASEQEAFNFADGAA